MLKTVLDNGSGIFILEETGHRHLQQHLRGITLIHPYEGGPSVPVADVWEENSSTETVILTAHNTTPWVPVTISLPVSLNAMLAIADADEETAMLKDGVNEDLLAASSPTIDMEREHEGELWMLALGEALGTATKESMPRKQLRELGAQTMGNLAYHFVGA